MVLRTSAEQNRTDESWVGLRLGKIGLGQAEKETVQRVRLEQKEVGPAFSAEQSVNTEVENLNSSINLLIWD